MIELSALMPVINFVLICVLGSWLYWERRRRRMVEDGYTQDIDELHVVADKAASEAASCATVLDRYGACNHASRRRLHAVRNERTGTSSWHWLKDTDGQTPN